MWMIMGYPTNLVLHTTMEYIATYHDIYEPCTDTSTPCMYTALNSTVAGS